MPMVLDSFAFYFYVVMYGVLECLKKCL